MDPAAPQISGFTLATKKDFEDFRNDCNETQGWSVVFDKKEWKVWDKTADNSPINMVKMWAILPISAATTYDVFHDPDYRKTWDESMIEGALIEQLDTYNDVGYYSAKSPIFTVSNRDFCNQRSWWTDGTEYFIINHTVPHPKCPEKKGFVRANSIRTGYWLRPLKGQEDSHCEMVYLTQTDPGGWIPAWAANQATKTFAPKIIDNLNIVGPKYNAWKAQNNPDLKIWLSDTPYHWEKK